MSELSPYAVATAEELRELVGREGSSETPRLERALNRATAWAERLANREFVSRGDVTEYHDTSVPRADLQLSGLPIVSVTSVHESRSLPPVYGADELLQEGTDFYVDKGRGVLTRISSGVPIAWGAGLRAVKVVASYGWQDATGSPAAADPVPEDLVQAVLAAAAAIYKESDRKAWAVSAVTDSMGSVTRFLGYFAPSAVAAVKAYRLYSYGRTWVRA